jgi:hypothetical protein
VGGGRLLRLLLLLRNQERVRAAKQTDLSDANLITWRKHDAAESMPHTQRGQWAHASRKGNWELVMWVVVVPQQGARTQLWGGWSK